MLISHPKQAERFVSGMETVPLSLFPLPHAVLVYIPQSPSILLRDGPLNRVWPPFKTEKIGRGEGSRENPAQQRRPIMTERVAAAIDSNLSG